MADMGRGRRRGKDLTGILQSAEPSQSPYGSSLGGLEEAVELDLSDTEELVNPTSNKRLFLGQQGGSSAVGQGADPWSCSVCTLINGTECDKCEACLAPRERGVEEGEDWRSPYGQNDSERGPSVVTGGAEWACELCTFSNEFEASECEACSHRKPPNPPQLAFEAGQDLNRPVNPSSQFSAGPASQVNGVVGTPQVEGREGEMVVTSVGVPEITNTEEAKTGAEEEHGDSVSVAKVAGVVAQGPTKSAVEAQERRLEELAGPSSSLKCGICSCNQTLDTFCLDGCSHRFCTACLRAAVQGQIAALPPAESADSQQVFEAGVCPMAGCKAAMTQRDLILVAGEERARSHQRWLYQVLTRACRPEPAPEKCTSCGEEELSKVKMSQLASLSLRDIRRALKARRLDASGKHPECVQRLFDVFPEVGGASSSEQWICISCPKRSFVPSGGGVHDQGHERLQRVCREALQAVTELENAYKAYIVSDDSSPTAKPNKRQKTFHEKGGVWAAGTGYGGAWDHLHHYQFMGGKKNKRRDPALPPAESAAESKAKKTEKAADDRLVKAMDALIACLSGGSGEGLVTGLSLPLVAVVHESGVTARVLRALLLNDSMIDVSQRGGLYLKALQLMRVLGAREELLPVLCESPPKRPKVAPKPTPPLPQPTKNSAALAAPEPVRRSGRRNSGDRKGKRKAVEVADEAPDEVVSLEPEKKQETEREEEEDEAEGTVLDAMEKLYKQASVVKVGLMGGVADEMASDELDIGLVCEICDAFEELQRGRKGWQEARVALRSAQGLGAGPTTEIADGSRGLRTGTELEVDDEEDCLLVDRRSRRGKKAETPVLSREDQAKAQASSEATYKSALKDLQFRMEPLVNAAGKPDHYFREKKNAIDNGGVHSQKRMLAISKEIGSLVTTLPLEWGSSVHVRVDEERMDLVKALIIGPGGTPYQNGAFLFDILLPPDYPQVSPKVQFMTTGGGRTRFNPNLYADGKVCLSILGTWAGPGWQPGKSTLMQVLLSIQGMIFVPEPYFNEPGFEAHGNKTASNNYNRNQRRNTLQLAIVGMLRNPPAVFADVIRTHFKLKRQEIEAQCQAWADDDFKPKPEPKKKAKKAKKKSKKQYDSDGLEWSDEDSDEDAYYSSAMGGAMGGMHLDYESGRGSPIETSMKELLAELAKL